MAQTLQSVEKDFLNYVKKMAHLNEAIGVMYWDLRTGAPKKGATQRSEVIGTLAADVFAMSTSDEMKQYIDELSEPTHYATLSDITKKTLEEVKKEYERNAKIPPAEFKEYVILQSNAESIWEEAREKSDFSMFQPYLEKLVETNKRFIGYWGYEGNKYNTLLDMYEPGMTVDILDRTFKKLRDHIVPLLQKITTKQQPNQDFLFTKFPKEQQKDFSLHVLKEMGYDFEAGRLDETVHPFATGLSPGDVRVTTRYDEQDFRTAVFGTIHEGGHALYEQNISPKLIGTPLCTGASMGIHESQSLFWENMIGRHFGFWQNHYETLKSYSAGQFDAVSLEDFYKAINVVEPSLIRIEADELTYPLHVIVRYEIEKGLFNDEIEVKDLPRVWNEKMQEYLGITPPNDAQGVLQDVHWSGGSFGYFPSYALGYIYAAQLKNSMKRDLPNVDEAIANGQFELITKWLQENIHQYGMMKKPMELLQDVTGEGLNADHLIAYFENKYSAIYDVK
ncbi:thermostable carboxypeptidase 1 [Fictibacillus macauensis ZFHKF-1]|uniref:Metal-dependent carboxypeptidase n=1 Tax=Fictibacillus macauensis ZFHKF-1 TaxID=1196324 RepID=I8J4F1_9BACL|nr:carboxypeptidase M32 [Fictibacillus macauensis]EIT86651.1 thermostable carboxypeptidase 1 [Fictibacillus macauensis ZFHKF-1]